MDFVKRAARIFGIAAIMIIMSAVSVLAATEGNTIEEPKRVYNAGFEEPTVSGSYQQVPASKVPYWGSTAATSNIQIELWRQNTGVYISNEKITPKVGYQAAELNSQEASTMYQYVYGTAGSVYEWGISHRGRADKRIDTNNVVHKDTMAVFIGPKQQYDPKKTDSKAANTDQFTKTVDWLKENGHLNTSDLNHGDCKAFEVFTTKFNNNGGFEGDADKAISMTQDDIHTEKWHVWIITSGMDNWYDYGVTAAEDCAVYGGGQDGYSTYKITNSSDEMEIRYKQPDYNYQYTVPTGGIGTIYAFCAYDTAYAYIDASKKLTYGNFIDDVRLSMKVPVRVTSTEGGSTEVEIPGSKGTVTNATEFKGTTDAGEKIKLTITPGEKGGDEVGNYTFLGAFVNNKWKSATDTNLFTDNNDGTYTYNQDAEDGENYIHIVFAKNPYIIHSPNGGTYKNTTADTADKIERVGDYEFSDAPTAGNQAQFAHWIIAGVTNTDGTPVTVGANHTVEAVDNNQGAYNIQVKDEKGIVVATINNTDVVVFVAHYKYPQTVNIYTMIGGKWELSDTGGTASVSGVNILESPSNELPSATQTIYVEDNTIVSVSASPNDNYRLVRMVSDNTVTTEKTYTYNADGPRTTEVYFMEGNRKPIVSYVDENNQGDSLSYVWDTNLGDENNNKKTVSDVGGIYGNTVSTAFSGFWAGDENTYTYIQWAIDLKFDTDTLVKTNSIHGELSDITLNTEGPYKTDSDAVNTNFKGAIYKCTGDITKQLVVSFPTVFTGKSSVYSTIILDGIYSPNSTALLHSVTEINAQYGNILTQENGFSVTAAIKDAYDRDENNYYITELK